MPLIFPSNPTVNQTYQSGSTATYQWDGTKWTVVTPTATTVVTARSASFASTSTSSSFATSATTAVSSSALSGSVPTYIFAYNIAGQSVVSKNTTTTVTNWTNVITNNAGEWNNTTGVFTATKSGSYFVSAQIGFASNTGVAIGDEYNAAIVKNGAYVAVSFNYSQTTTSIIRVIPPVNCIVTLAPGDTLVVRAYQASGASRALISSNTWTNVLTIQELPNRIQR